MKEVTIAPPPTAPAGLSADGPGRRLWDLVLDKRFDYLLNPAELRILEDACFIADEIAYFQAETWACRRDAKDERVVRGSTGQRKLNPLLDRADKAADRATRNRVALSSLLVKLKLPDLEVSDLIDAPTADQQQTRHSA